MMGSKAPESNRETAAPARLIVIVVAVIVVVAISVGGILLGGGWPAGPGSGPIDIDPPAGVMSPKSTGPGVGTASDPDALPPSATDPATSEPLPCARLGVYTDSTPDSDLETLEHFGVAPAVANTFYQPDQAIDMAGETERIRRGTSPNLTITSKGTNYIEALGTGRSHSDFAEAHAWLTAWVDGVARLARVDRDVPVYATVEHEFRVKARTGLVTGLSADPAYYGRALDRFYATAEAAHPNIRTTYWIVGFDRTFEGTVAEEFTTLPDAVLFDPYANEVGETVRSMTEEDLAWIRSQDWYVGQEIGLGEFGMPVEYGDAELERFYTGFTDALASQGIAWGVFFNRERDFDTRITDREDGRTFPRAVSALRASIADGC